MRVLIPSGDTRAHAQMWKADAYGHTVFTDRLANPGMLEVASPLVGMDRDDPISIAEAAQDNKIDLTFPSGEALYDKGIVDEFNRRHLRIVGPTREQAKLETSKWYCVETLRKAGVRVPETTFCDSFADLVDKTDKQPMPFVIKFDGLALGKGVKVVRTPDELTLALEHMQQYGDGPFLLQEFIEGEEVSYFAATNGVDAKELGTAGDYKLLGNLMTGGMGGFARHPRVNVEMSAQIMRDIVTPTVLATSFHGILYFGLIIARDGTVCVLEINVRMGDPEAQVLLPLMLFDFISLMWATTTTAGELGRLRLPFQGRVALGVVLASHGYPEKARKGDQISIDYEKLRSARIMVFQGGTAEKDYRLVTNGGRVLTLVTLANTFREARENIYGNGIPNVRFQGMQFRDDIGVTM